MGTFAYHLVLSTDDSQPVSLIAAWIEADQPLQAILWSAGDLTWIYAPALAARRLNDHENQDTVKPLDRATAERTAATVLGTELPSEATLLQMCRVGQATGPIRGPRPG